MNTFNTETAADSIARATHFEKRTPKHIKETAQIRITIQKLRQF
jgi:hypothetical protein